MLEKVQTIAIVGGGLSGTLVAIQLLEQANQPLHIILLERASRPARGVAYDTQECCHLLNVPAGKMSAFSNKPGHFYTWANTQNSEIEASSFVPRRLYGEYLSSCLEESVTSKRAKIKFTLLHNEVIDLQREGNRFSLQLQDGKHITADIVVLALGNAPSVLPAQPHTKFYNHARFYQNPWSHEALADLNPDKPVLIIGTGLTMVDKVIELNKKGLREQIYAISRSGLMPRIHDISFPPYEWSFAHGYPTRVHQLFRQIRDKIAQGHDWRSVLDGLRPHSQAIWQGMSNVEKRRFLRHVRPYWENHRHRIAPVIGEQILRLINEERLVILAGRLQSYQVQDEQVIVTYRPRKNNQVKTLEVDRVLNCSGSGSDFRHRREALSINLINQGLLVPNHLGLGVEALSDGHLLDKTGASIDGLYTLGPPLKGLLWETTAVPEIRLQAEKLASTILSALENRTLLHAVYN